MNTSPPVIGNKKCCELVSDNNTQSSQHPTEHTIDHNISKKITQSTSTITNYLSGVYKQQFLPPCPQSSTEIYFQRIVINAMKEELISNPDLFKIEDDNERKKRNHDRNFIEESDSSIEVSRREIDMVIFFNGIYDDMTRCHEVLIPYRSLRFVECLKDVIFKATGSNESVQRRKETNNLVQIIWRIEHVHCIIQNSSVPTLAPKVIIGSSHTTTSMPASVPKKTTLSTSPFFEYGCNDIKQVYHGWLNAVRCGCLMEMEVAHSMMYSLIWWCADDSDEKIVDLGVADSNMMCFREADYQFGFKIATKAVQYGNLEALRKLRTYGCPMDSTAATMAASTGNIAMLEVLYQFDKDNLSEIDGVSGFITAQDIACWSQDSPNVRFSQDVPKNDIGDAVDLIDGWACCFVAEKKSKNTFNTVSQWLKDKQISTNINDGDHGSWRHNAKTRALGTGSKKSSEEPIVPSTTHVGSRIGYSIATKFFENGLTMDDQEQILYGYINAARCGSLDVMEWAHQQNYSKALLCTNHNSPDPYYPECPEICAKAAEYGRLEHLKKLRELGFPWDEETTRKASENGNLAILKWALLNKCPIDFESSSKAARTNQHTAIDEWLLTEYGKQV